MTAAEKRVAAVFLLVVLGWVLRRPLAIGLSIDSLSDTGIALMGAIALFVLPSGDRQQSQLLVWEDVSQLPWGVLVLFGGGLSLASAIASSGLAQWLGEGLAPLALFGVAAMILGATALVIFLTEMTSNLATTATFFAGDWCHGHRIWDRSHGALRAGNPGSELCLYVARGHRSQCHRLFVWVD
jgi:sodium-dependent dicarboxylate transporter 2/3/5